LCEIESVKPLEAVINGINLSAYNYDGQDLTSLMESLNGVDCRIRLGSLEVGVITDRFLEALKGLKNFAPHFHLSLQSGSNAVLKSMNRHYTADEFISKVNLIRQYFEDAGITTDIIAGFPTETEENFTETLALVEKVKFSDIHPFIYSARSGTVAYKMPDLDYSIKKERADRLIAKKQQLKLEFASGNVGKELDFLPEEKDGEFWVGYSGNYLRLYVKGEVDCKKIIKVKVIKPYLDGAIAEII
jgi:threonylcarbamoyladenosine tRNA methylthiotransferase MtaB